MAGPDFLGATVRRVNVDGLVFYQFEHLAGQADVVHGLFTRRGGVSEPPWFSLNLSRSTGDSLEAVTENNRRLLGAVGLKPEQTVSAWLDHGDHIAVVGLQHLGTALHKTDAMISATPGLTLSMRFADCVPVLFHDSARSVIGIAHAGWQGVAASIIGKTVQAMQETFGCRPSDVWAGIGPAIRAECYPFGLDQAQRVVAACPPGAAVVIPQPDGSIHLNLIAAVKSQLDAAGVGDVEDSGICTACHTDEWFSHRVEKRTGRFGVVMGLKA
jgi:YfiH family protein